MLKLRRVVFIAALGMISPIFSLTGRAESLRFAWPDGASAKVHARSDGRRVQGGRERAWDMSCDFTVHVRRDGDRVVVSRKGFSGWKGRLPPSFGGGAERFIDMIPTFIVSGSGKFIGVEGHEATRKLIATSVEQSGGLNPMERKAFETLTSDAALEAMAKDHWSALIGLWEDVELDPAASYELRSVTSVPQFGGGQVDITGEVQFVKETDCAAGGGGQRCAHFRAETGADKGQVAKLIESLLRRAGADGVRVTAWDQRLRAEIIVDKATMLPQQFTITRLHTLGFRLHGREEVGSEEITKTYTFTWLVPDSGRKK